MTAPLTVSSPAARKAVLALSLNALFFGLSWLPFRALEALGLHPLWSTAIAYAGVVLLITLAKPQAWRWLLGSGALCVLMAASGVTNVAFNWAVTTGDVVRVVLLFYLMPAWALLLAWPILGERPDAAALWRLLLALCGVVLILKSPEQDWPMPESLADWLSLLGGFSFALTNVLLRKLQHTRNVERMLAMFAGGAFMALVTALVGGPVGLVNAPPLEIGSWLAWSLLLGLGLLLANLGLQYGAARLPARVTAVVLLSEVLFASVSSVWLGAGTLSARIVLGGVLILAASVLAMRTLRK